MEIKRNGFTLAEFLITLTIIGVVAALTLPTLIKNYTERSYKSASTNFETKLGEAIRVMNAQNLLIGYNSTEDFVEELSKHIKITKVCENPSACFNDEFKSADKTTIATENIDTRFLGHTDWGTNVVGVQFANGVNALLAYNPNFLVREDSKVVNFTNGKFGNMKTVKMGTNAISVLYDVSGFEKPNMVGEDIIGINASLTGSGIQCTTIGKYSEYCIVDFGTNYESVNCSKAGYNEEYCENYSGQVSAFATKNYWAGANKICKDNGMRLPSGTELGDMYNMKTLGVEGIPASGSYASTDTAKHGGGLNFETGSNIWKNGGYQFNVLCVN